MYIFKNSFHSIRQNLIFHSINFFYKNISIVNNVGIGTPAFIMASISHIHIGNNVAFAPIVTIKSRES